MLGVGVNAEEVARWAAFKTLPLASHSPDTMTHSMSRAATPTRPPILIAGASARAAAFSAVAAGLAPQALDLFADDDLATCCPTIRVAGYPRGFAGAARSLPGSPWLYTGGLENHPRIVEAISRERSLWGNGGAVLRRVRDPWGVAETLHAAKINVPPLRRADNSRPPGIDWLLKSTGSSGGLGVRLGDQCVPPSTGRHRWYVQERVLGRSLGAVFLAADGAARLLGVTDQLVGTSWTGAPPFHYAGSIGPLRLTPRARATVARIGDCLAAEYQLVGLFGVDLIRDRQGRYWPVEVNPRYPASAEVLELATGVSIVGLHARACTERTLPQFAPLASRGYVGKAVVYAPGDFIVTATQNRRWHASNNSLNTASVSQSNATPVSCFKVADIPRVGTQVPSGAPVVTLLERGRDVATVRRRLRSRCVALRNRLQLPSLRTP